jgi:hypothetical protein
MHNQHITIMDTASTCNFDKLSAYLPLVGMQRLIYVSNLKTFRNIDLLDIPTDGRAVACNADMKIMMFVKALRPMPVFKIRL